MKNKIITINDLSNPSHLLKLKSDFECILDNNILDNRSVLNVAIPCRTGWIDNVLKVPICNIKRDNKIRSISFQLMFSRGFKQPDKWIHLNIIIQSMQNDWIQLKPVDLTKLKDLRWEKIKISYDLGQDLYVNSIYNVLFVLNSEKNICGNLYLADINFELL